MLGTLILFAFFFMILIQINIIDFFTDKYYWNIKVKCLRKLHLFDQTRHVIEIMSQNDELCYLSTHTVCL